MRWKCNCCKKDFTTFGLAGDKEKLAFKHSILDKMKCPNCGATNKNHVNAHRSPFARMDNEHYDDCEPPNIELHTLCQSRQSGSITYNIPFTVNCDGCPSQFSCLSGNVDDGVVEEKPPEDARKEADVSAIKKSSDQHNLGLWRVKMGKKEIGIEVGKDSMRLKFKGTIWKLDTADTSDIIDEKWQTKKCKEIKASIDKAGISCHDVMNLLRWELFANKSS